MKPASESNENLKNRIQRFLNGKTIAIVGVSRNKRKFGYLAYAELKEAGYRVFPVNPNVSEIEGEHCYPQLSAIGEKVESMLVCTESAAVVLDEALALGIQNIWFQNGIDTGQLGNIDALGLTIVHNECILMYANPRKFPHNLHRFFRKTFSTLPA